MSTTSEQHAEHLDREQAEGDWMAEESEHLAEEYDQRRRALLRAGLPLDPPPSPEDEETLPVDPERAA